MNLAKFIDKKKPNWVTLETLIAKLRANGNFSKAEFQQVGELYRSVTSDYAFARANFPKEKIVIYLSRLVAEAHGTIYQTPRLTWFKIKKFFLYSGPQLFRTYQRFFWIASAIFVLFLCLGFWACEIDKNYEKTIMGGNYVYMTEHNIEKKKPFNVYADKYKFVPFAQIMFNNIGVLLRAFVLGLTACLGTLYFLTYNAIMVGCFFHIFYRHDIVTDFWLTIMIHGTIELTMIVFGCATGFMLGWNILFPRTYTRRDAFRIYGLQALKMAVICAFWLIIAGFLESFITGLELGRAACLTIILLSAVAMIWYFGYLGRKKANPTWFV